jgi:hypothetical protein
MILPMTQGPHQLAPLPQTILSNILQTIGELQAKQQRSLVVFDLDSTLFDVSPRLQKIIHDFAEIPENIKKFPESVAALMSVRTLPSDWGIRGALVRAGLATHPVEFHQAIKKFWMDRFFTNEYLDHDHPYEGAVEYVQKIANLGSDIVYLTGRDQLNMEAGTIRTLKKWQFPIDNPSLQNQKIQLVMKPLKGSDDALFKRDWFSSTPMPSYSRIWFFENEPANIQAVRQHLAHIGFVFFDSTHSGVEAIPTDITAIKHFKLHHPTEG